MRFLKTLIILAIFVMTCQATTKQTLHTFDTFTIRNSKDKSCFTTIGKETEDSTKVNVGKCIEGCGGFIKISKGLKAQQYNLAIYSEATCKLESGISTKAEFICPNPSIKSIEISGTDNNVKCGTLPPSDEIDEDADADVIETNPKSTQITKKPKDPNEIQDINDSTTNSDSETDASGSTTKPKSKGHGANADEETANSNSATSIIGTISALTIASIIAVLSL